MKKPVSKILAVVLTLALGISALPAGISGGILISQAGKNEEQTTQSRIENSSASRFGASDVQTPTEDEAVTFMVLLKTPPLLDVFSEEEIEEDTPDVQAYRENQSREIEELSTELEMRFGTEKEFRINYTYVLSMTGLSVTTRYGNREAVEALDGVDDVYVAPQFETAQEENEICTYTGSAAGMIGATSLQDLGYTGKGMKIAVIDTGIKTDHPSFSPLEEEKLTEDSLTQEDVENVWEYLNAGSMTSGEGSEAFVSTKIPFAFNYEKGNFDVSHSASQNDDHGTHVAGIAAANKREDTEVIGIAPDAQIIVMQVFRNGSAGWDTIVAALEDCLYLDVDVVNLSLGDTAGFTDDGTEVSDVLNRFSGTHTQVAAAAGNDTHAGVGNLTGTDLSKSGNPDHGLLGKPATAAEAITVASTDNEEISQYYITVCGADGTERQIGFSDSAASSDTNFLSRLKGQTLDYVMIGGYGEKEDYAGKDVEGKVAVVSRGEITFTQKQEVAQSMGAAALIVCNTDDSVITMNIHDGAGYIPCVAVRDLDGQWLAQQGAEGSLTVCGGDMIRISMEGGMSDFSSWGVTPDLKLKPEIAGVGGNVMSTRDSSISAVDYGMDSGTSMATPQIAGALAVLTQYLKEEYSKDCETAEERSRTAVNLMMSTADPLTEEGTEVSPRLQGAGLVNLTDATTADAYLTGNSVEERPKGEMGDDEEESGVFTFSFTLTNLSDEPQRYTVDATVMTPDLVTIGTSEDERAGSYMADTERVCSQAQLLVRQDGEVQNEIVVGAKSSLTLEATVELGEEDKRWIRENFENGIYVEGYLYLNNEQEGKAGLSMPFLGYFGDWSKAPVFDENDPEEASLFSPVIYTDQSFLNVNPYFEEGKGGAEYNAVSYSNQLLELDFGLLRSVREMVFTVTDIDTQTVYFTYTDEWVKKSYYDSEYGCVIPYFLYNQKEDQALWDLTYNGQKLADGTRVTYRAEAYLDDGDDLVDDVYAFQVTIDDTAPEIRNEEELGSAVTQDAQTGERTLCLTCFDNLYLAAVLFESEDGQLLDKYEVENTPGEELTQEFDITDYGTEFSVTVADYACNETTAQVHVNPEEEPGETEETEETEEPETEESEETEEPETEEPETEESEKTQEAETEETEETEEPEKPTEETEEAKRPAETEELQETAEKTVLAAPKIRSAKVGAYRKGVYTKLTLTKVDGADHYDIYRVAGGKKKKIGSTKTTTFRDKNPTKRSVSYYAVAVAKDGSVSADGARRTVRAAKATKIQSVTRKKDGIRLTWKKVKGAREYVIYRSTKKNSGYVRIAVVKKGAKQTYTDRKVKKGKYYYYKVAVVGSTQASLPSSASGRVRG